MRKVSPVATLTYAGDGDASRILILTGFTPTSHALI